MRKTVLSTALAAAAALAAAPGLATPDAYADASVTVLTEPMSGVEDGHWLDYRTDVLEAEGELRSDLARANDDGDVYDAHAEFNAELADALYDYQKEMIEAGIPVGRVIVGAGD